MSGARRVAILLGVFLAAGTRTAAAAPGDKQACVDAATRGQIQRDDHKLSAAVEAFGVCAAASCPPAVRKSCADWLEETKAQIPSVTVPRVADASLQIDGAPAKFGEARSLDPGAHIVRMEAPGHAPVTEPFDLDPGEKKTLELRFPPPPPAPPAPRTVSTRPIPPLVFILGGVAVVGGVGFAVFGLTAKAKTDRLSGGCAPSCEPAERDAAFRTAVVADVSLVIGSLAAVAAGVFFVTRPSRQSVLQGASDFLLRGTF